MDNLNEICIMWRIYERVVATLDGGLIMKRYLAFFLSAVLLMTAIPVGIASAANEPVPIKVLAIGNSYSNNVTQYIQGVAESMGLDISAASLYYPGCDLKRHVAHYQTWQECVEASDGDIDAARTLYHDASNSKKYEELSVNGKANYSIRSLYDAVRYDDWDYITIQQSPDGCDDFDTYWTEEKPYLTKLYDFIQAEYASMGKECPPILVHQTWSFNDDMCKDNAYTYWPVDYNNTADMFAAIEDANNKAVAKIKEVEGLDKAPTIIRVGEAIQLAQDQYGYSGKANPTVANGAVYADTISHLNPRGRYIAACVWIETLAKEAGFTADCRTATYVPNDPNDANDDGMTLEDCKILQYIAHEVMTGDNSDTVFGDWRVVPNGDGVKLTHYMGEAPADGVITIPETVNGKTVNAIDSTVFKYVSGITEVILPFEAEVESGAFNGLIYDAPADVNKSLLETLGVTEGDVLAEHDYSALSVGDTSYRNHWTGNAANSITSFTPNGSDTAVNGLYIRSANDLNFNYTIPAKNFVIKLNMYSTYEGSGTWDIFMLNSDEETMTSLQSPAYRRGDDHIKYNQFTIMDYLGGSSRWIDAVGYDLSVNNSDMSMQIICYEGYVYYLNREGAVFYKSPLSAELTDTNTFRIRVWAGGVTITNMTVSELVIEDTFASSIGAQVSESIFHRDYTTLQTRDTSSYLSDFSAMQGTLTVATTTPANKDKSVTGLSVRADNGSASVDISFKATDYVAKITYVHSSHNTGMSQATIQDRAGNYNAGLRLPFSNHTHTNNHWDLLAQDNRYQVISSATGSYSRHIADESIWDLYNEATPSSYMNVEVELYVYSYKGYVYYVTFDNQGNQVVLHKNLAYATLDENKTIRLLANYGGIVVTNVDVLALVTDNSLENTVADAFNAVVGEVIDHQDYSAQTSSNNNYSGKWTATSGSTGITTVSSANVNGLSASRSQGDAFVDYSIPNKNFVLKATLYTSSHNGGVFGIQVLNSNKNIVTKVVAPYYNRNNGYEPFVHNDLDERNQITTNRNQLGILSSASANIYKNIDINLYDFDKYSVPVTFYIFCFEGTYYIVDYNGDVIHSHTNSANSLDEQNYIRLYSNYGACVMTEFTVKELKSVFGKGTGTESDPYLISTPEQLYNVVGSFGGGKYYKLANDIYLNDVDAIDWTTGEVIKDGYEPNVWFGGSGNGEYGAATSYYGKGGETTGKFNGTIDGNGYSVNGIYIMPYSSSYDTEKYGAYPTVSAFLPTMSGGKVCNLVVANSYIASAQNAGGIVGYLTGTAEISSVKVESTVTIKRNKTIWYQVEAAGGMVGYAAGNLTLNGVGSEAYITGFSSALGFVGTYYNKNVTIRNSYSLGMLPIASSTGIHGNSGKLTLENVYSDTEPTASQWIDDTTLASTGRTRSGSITVVSTIKGADAMGEGAMSGLDGSVWYAVSDDKTPMLRVRGEVIADVNESGAFDYASDTAALRQYILGIKDSSKPNNANYNRDQSGTVDILDLVKLVKASGKQDTSAQFGNF